MLDKLNRKNDVLIESVGEKSFSSYGRIVTGYDFTELISYMEKETEVPTEGNIYIPSVEEMERLWVSKKVEKEIYGEMPIQIGYCNGKNSKYNGFEYHKGSEINIAVTDFMLVLGHSYEMVGNTFETSNAKVFFVPKGTAIEMYQTTLHLSPCKVCDEGFKDIIILPKGTNTPLEYKKSGESQENKILFQKNKWMIAHKERKVLTKQGVYPGLLGENIELLY